MAAARVVVVLPLFPALQTLPACGVSLTHPAARATGELVKLSLHLAGTDLLVHPPSLKVIREGMLKAFQELSERERHPVEILQDKYYSYYCHPLVVGGQRALGLAVAVQGGALLGSVRYAGHPYRSDSSCQAAVPTDDYDYCF